MGGFLGSSGNRVRRILEGVVIRGGRGFGFWGDLVGFSRFFV